MILRVFTISLLFFFAFPEYSYAGKCVPDAPAGVKRALRSPAQASKFKKLTPGTGIVDHICSLNCGGIDRPINMQWQTKADSDAKDRVENTQKGKELYCNEGNSLPYRTVWNLNATGRKAVYGVK